MRKAEHSLGILRQRIGTLNEPEKTGGTSLFWQQNGILILLFGFITYLIP